MLADLPPETVVLIVEDEYLIADDVRKSLLSIGVEVVGPVASIGNAIKLIDSSARVDVCVLDINLHGVMVYALADELEARKIPFIFLTGYERVVIPERFSHITRCEKPVQIHELLPTLAGCLQSRATAA